MVCLEVSMYACVCEGVYVYVLRVYRIKLCAIFLSLNYDHLAIELICHHDRCVCECAYV